MVSFVTKCLFGVTMKEPSRSLNQVQHFKTKHIEIRYHFIWDPIRRGEIELNYVNTHDNLADIFTKPLDEARFRELRHELNIIDLSNVT